MSTLFQDRRFDRPFVRLIKVTAKIKGAYAFEAFAFEKGVLQRFEIRFLPNRPYFAVNFFTPEPPLHLDDEEVGKAADTIATIVMRHRKEWTGKVSIEEMVYNFINLLISTEGIKIPEADIDEIQAEIEHIFANPSFVKTDVKGRPYYSNMHYGKFFLTETGTIREEDYERYDLKIEK